MFGKLVTSTQKGYDLTEIQTLSYLHEKSVSIFNLFKHFSIFTICNYHLLECTLILLILTEVK